MVDFFVLDKKVESKKFSAKTLNESARKKLIWIDISDHQKEIFEILKPLYHLHPLVVEDSVYTTKTLPKIEEFNSYNFLIIYSASLDKTIKTMELDFFIGKNLVISSHHGSIDSFENLKKDAPKLSSLMELGPDFLLHALIDMEVDKQIAVLEQAEDFLDELSLKIVSHPKDSVLENLFSSKKELRKLRKIFTLQNHVIDSLSKKQMNFFSANVRSYFRDTYDHSLITLDMIENQREIIDNNIQVHFSMATTKLNEIMKVLTIIATIVMPLTLISSLYGMNFKYMPELSMRYGYPAVIGLMVFIAIMMILYFKKKKWV